jgi:hypothetical protein
MVRVLVLLGLVVVTWIWWLRHVMILGLVTVGYFFLRWIK